MILLVDLGNTRMKWAMFEGGCIAGEASTVHSGAHIEALLDLHWRTLHRPRHIVAVNVAGETSAAAIADWCRTHWHVQPRFVRPEAAAHGVSNGYAQPARLGADRWASLIGARKHYGGVLCIVGCGTALTIDVLDAEGCHLGGVIMPGLTAMRQALYQATAGIPDEGESELVLLARDTRSAVTSGVFYAASGGIDRLVDDIDTRFSGGVRCLMTGGDAERLRPLLRHNYEIVPDLVFKGLAVLAEEADENRL